MLFAAAALFLLVWSNDAGALEGRVALVVGNTNYSNAPRLLTPVDDADDIAATLTDLGFDVMLRKDAGIEDMRRALQEFTQKSAKADISIVYFAGYGIFSGIDGYLVPIDAQLSASSAFRSEAVALRAATLAVARAQSLGLVILDALRGNPYLAKLERQDAPGEADAAAATIEGFRNVVVYFAADPGKSAEPGNGRNSPLATALLKHLPAPDVEINFLFRNVRDEVRKSTQQKQTPYTYGQLSKRKIFLNPVAQPKQMALAAHTPDPKAAHPCDRVASLPADSAEAARAVADCTEAAKQFPGVDRFQYLLGRALFAARDYPAALASYKKAYELGNTQALYALAAMYDEGMGVGKDPVRARFYYEIAAEKKFAPAIVNLGIQNERGIGGAIDYNKAYSLYGRAADLGDARAITKMGLFAENGQGVAKNPKQARALYEKSAAMGDHEGMINLARCVANGIGGKKDVAEARRLLEKAALAGSAEAKRILASVDGAKRK